MARLEKRGGGAYRVRIRAGGVDESKTFKDEASARSWAQRREQALRRRGEINELLASGSGLPHLPEKILRAAASIPVTPAEICESALPVSVMCGIYFLICAGKIEYVGKSKDVLRRIARHRDMRTVDFDEFSIIPCGMADLDRLESEYILALQPTRNRALGNAS